MVEQAAGGLENCNLENILCRGGPDMSGKGTCST
jgi:hypothetical protein